MSKPRTHFDLVVVGAGSGGFAAALAAARLGTSVVLVERGDSLGGNAARGGVNNWEPGVGGTGIPFDLYRRLQKIPDAVGIYSFGRHFAWQGKDVEPKFPGGELLIDPGKTYLDSLRRFGAPAGDQAEPFQRQHWHGVPFEPAVYAAEMERMLAETGCCVVRKSTAFTDVARDNAQITSLSLDDGTAVTAAFYIDATADVLLAQRLGCRTSFGQEARALYQEPSAPRAPNDRINGATLIYRIAPSARPAVEPLPANVPARCWWSAQFPIAAFTQYPNGDFNVNSLPTMAGREVVTLGYGTALAECQRRIRAHWHHLQTTFEEFRSYRVVWTAPALGIREGPRLVGRYVLTEHDLIAGINGQSHADIIALADHARDTHGADTGRAGTGELAQPYGIPFRCLLPAAVGNLAVACRGASFSSVAASSCRLSRTMMQLGQAAGTATALAVREGLTDLSDVPAAALRASLLDQHAELSWPRPVEMEKYLQSAGD